MTEFAPYTTNILLAYGCTLMVVGWLVVGTWRGASRTRPQDRSHDDITA